MQGSEPRHSESESGLTAQRNSVQDLDPTVWAAPYTCQCLQRSAGSRTKVELHQAWSQGTGGRLINLDRTAARVSWNHVVNLQLSRE